jgi:hypothetical protein
VNAYLIIAAVVLLVGAGALGWWWGRGRRPSRDSEHVYRSIENDTDDLTTMTDLFHELRTTQRNMSAQLNELGSRIEILSHEFLAGQRRVEEQVGNLTAQRAPHTEVEVPARQRTTNDSRVDSGPTPYRPPILRIDPERSIASRSSNPNVASGSAGVSTTSDSDLLESAASAFLLSADSKEFDNAAVTRFFAERGASASFVLEAENRWAMIAVHSARADSRAVGIPAIRVGMRQIDLKPYFDFVNYNGLDPIRSAQVVRLAGLSRLSGTWTTTQKGIIDGSR